MTVRQSLLSITAMAAVCLSAGGRASADEKTDAYEAAALQIVTAYECRPLLSDPRRYEKALAISRNRLMDAGFSSVDAERAVDQIEGALTPSEISNLDATFCDDFLRAFDGE